MKRDLLRILIALLFSYSTCQLSGQSGFDAKKKTGEPSNTSSLKAKSVNGINSSGTTALIGKSLGFSSPKVVQKSQSLQADTRFSKVIVSSKTNLPIYIESEGQTAAQSKSAVQKSASELAYQYLDGLKSTLKIESPEQSFAISRIDEDILGNKHIRMNQKYMGINIYGAEVMVHLNSMGEGRIFNGRYYNLSQKIDVTPLITNDKAIQYASAHLKSRNKKISTEVGENLLTSFEKPVSELVLLHLDNTLASYRLVYHLTLYTTDHHRWEYFVDARNGDIIKNLESVCYADGPKTATANDLNGVSRTINTYQVGSTYYMTDASRTMFNASASNIPEKTTGAIVTIDMNNTYGDNQKFSYIVSSNNTWTSPAAVSAHYNAGVAYEYYRQKYGRNSIDGNGGSIISIINVPEIETGDPMDNAFWNGKFMCYGNGFTSFKPLAGGLDVAGHEMTHGVVENTAALIYEGESGAINESMADIFGAMMDSEDWLIGEDVVKIAAFPSGALRSMSDPHNGGSSLSDPGYQPRIMNEKYMGSEDNSGVHINSGICNYAFYLYATAIGKDKAAAIYYKALKDYLTKSSQFIDLRLAVIQAAKDLYGDGSNEVTQAMNAFASVGIGEGQGNTNDPTLPDNPGDEYVLVYNTDLGDANTLYRSNLDYSLVEPLTTTELISRPSVTDDGSGAVFVAGDNTLHAIITTPGEQPDEFVIQEENIWSNAVISKDGNRLAAVTNYEDTSIYVYDFDSKTWAKFHLYNPTYTEGVKSEGPVYADALEFDYTGEYLVFDCFNRLENNDGSNIEYWNVNFIRVWNNETNDWGDGEIFKLFASLPDGISIGNPTFSKKSPNVIAFDYFSSDPEEYYILGCNIETNESNSMIKNVTLGWPSYNKDDSRIAFSSYSLSDEPQIAYILLNSDKISVQGDVQSMFTQAKWPVYFSTGNRILTDVKDNESNVSSLFSYPNPFSENIAISIPDGYTNSIVEIFNSTGQKVYSEIIDSRKNVTINLSHLEAGIYYLKLSGNNKQLTSKIIKTKNL